MSIAAIMFAAQSIAFQADPETARSSAAGLPVPTAEVTLPISADQAVPASSVNEGNAAADPESTPTRDTDPSTGPATPAAETTRSEKDIVVTGRAGHPPGDPLQGVNVQSYAIVQSVDEAVTGPVALAYKKSVPSPVRSGVRNFLSNLYEPVVALNYLLQLKPGKSAETVGRFAINSTVGAAGLFDVAKKRPFKLPRRMNGFGYTLGYYGVKPGAFLYLPLMGPTTIRDLVGRIADVSVLPLAVGAPFNDPLFTIPTTTVRLIDERAEADEGMHKLLDGADDPYSTVRADYLRTRQAEIDALHGRKRQSDPVPAELSEPASSTNAPLP
ncbi:MAG: MlaA family lipoprotein [Sphingobium sp.]